MQFLLFVPFFILYTALMELGIHAVAPLLGLIDRKKKWDIAIRTRVQSPSKALSQGQTGRTWIHAASLGEAKLAETVLSSMATTHPLRRYLLTATTRTGLERLRQIRNSAIDEIRLLPVDSPRLMRQLLLRYEVERVWLLETEVWPGMLWACKRRTIPVGSINARLEERSFRTYRMLRFFLGPLFQHLNPVLAQNRAYAHRFVRMGVVSSAVKITGNLKSNVQILTPSATKRASLRQALGLSPDQNVLTAGCFHPGETRVLIECLDELTTKGIDVKCIVVPRHLDAVPRLLEELPSRILHLTDCHTSSPWDICLIEKWGIMDAMYSIADIAVVGGTFVPIGGHSMWDAARHGIPVLFGPHHHTQEDSCRLLAESGTGFEVHSAAQLADAIRTHLNGAHEPFHHAIDNLNSLIASKQKSLELYL